MTQEITNNTSENMGNDSPISLEVTEGPFLGMTFDISQFEMTDEPDGSGLMNFDITLTDLNEQFVEMMEQGNSHPQYAECIDACGQTASEILNSALEAAYVDHLAQLKIQDLESFEQVIEQTPFETEQRKGQVLEKIENRIRHIKFMHSLDEVEVEENDAE